MPIRFTRESILTRLGTLILGGELGDVSWKRMFTASWVNLPLSIDVSPPGIKLTDDPGSFLNHFVARAAYRFINGFNDTGFKQAGSSRGEQTIVDEQVQHFLLMVYGNETRLFCRCNGHTSVLQGFLNFGQTFPDLSMPPSISSGPGCLHGITSNMSLRLWAKQITKYRVSVDNIHEYVVYRWKITEGEVNGGVKTTGEVELIRTLIWVAVSVTLATGVGLLAFR